MTKAKLALALAWQENEGWNPTFFNFQFSTFYFLLPDDVADEAGEGDGSSEDQRKERGQAADGGRDEGNHRDRTTDTLIQRPPDILYC